MVFWGGFGFRVQGLGGNNHGDDWGRCTVDSGSRFSYLLLSEIP